MNSNDTHIEALIQQAKDLRWKVPMDAHDRMVQSIYTESEQIARRNMSRGNQWRRAFFQNWLDRLLTSPWTGFPLMALIFAGILWMTIEGANVPSSMLATLLLDNVYPWLKGGAESIGLVWWLDGLLIDGVYLTVAWVISVMLPPMAIFFPLFTLLEDFGYLPRVAFNLDRIFQKSGGHGKQALTMAMGYGCNAAGVIAARIIDSPREKLIAIITNNFAICNGRWPTLFLVASIFIGALAPEGWGGLVAAGAVFGVAMFGIVLALLTSFVLSKTALKGESSAFCIELPPYRPPRILTTLYTSIIDRTLFVLWRAIIFAAPAGIVIWSICHIPVGDGSLATEMISALDILAHPLGLTGVILLAYIIAIPANEIIVPTILMLTVMVTGVSIDGAAGAGVMFETDNENALRTLLEAGGWTTLTAICLLTFCLCHNPCSTTIYTIYKETGSLRWTLWSTFIPVALGVVLCAVIATLWRAFI